MQGSQRLEFELGQRGSADAAMKAYRDSGKESKDGKSSKAKSLAVVKKEIFVEKLLNVVENIHEAYNLPVDIVQMESRAVDVTWGGYADAVDNEASITEPGGTKTDKDTADTGGDGNTEGSP